MRLKTSADNYLSVFSVNSIDNKNVMLYNDFMAKMKGDVFYAFKGNKNNHR